MGFDIGEQPYGVIFDTIGQCRSCPACSAPRNVEMIQVRYFFPSTSRTGTDNSICRRNNVALQLPDITKRLRHLIKLMQFVCA
jgi:hypothetical protein